MPIAPEPESGPLDNGANMRLILSMKQILVLEEKTGNKKLGD